MIRLRSCPFCGKKVAVATMSDDGDHWFYVHGVFRDDDHCHCRVFMESEKYFDDATKDEIRAIKSDLIAKWNRRIADG